MFPNAVGEADRPRHARRARGRRRARRRRSLVVCPKETRSARRSSGSRRCSKVGDSNGCGSAGASSSPTRRAGRGVRASGRQAPADRARPRTSRSTRISAWAAGGPRCRRRVPPRPGPKLRIALTVADGHALCYAAPTIRTFVRDGGPTSVDHLGPDLSDDAARSRRGARAHRPVRRAAISPSPTCCSTSGSPPASATCSRARRCSRSACTRSRRSARSTRRRAAGCGPLHTANSARTRGPGPRRTTVTNHGLAVYGRHHGGCPRCDGAIEYAPAGPGASSRSSYWCPVCQPAPDCAATAAERVAARSSPRSTPSRARPVGSARLERRRQADGDQREAGDGGGRRVGHGARDRGGLARGGRRGRDPRPAAVGRRRGRWPAWAPRSTRAT